MKETLKNLTKLRIAGMISDAASKEAASKINIYLTAKPIGGPSEKNNNLFKS